MKIPKRYCVDCGKQLKLSHILNYSFKTGKPVTLVMHCYTKPVGFWATPIRHSTHYVKAVK